MVDGTGAPPIEEANLIISGERITCVGPASRCPAPAEAEVLDVAGRWLTPGLVDAHVHFSQTGWVDGRPDALDVRDEYPYHAAVNALRRDPDPLLRAYLCSGVTAVFDVGGYPWTFELRDRSGPARPGPRIAAAGPLLSTRDHWVNLPAELQFVHIPDEEHVRAGVAYLAGRGSDAIKVWYLVRPGSEEEETYRPLLHLAGREAREAGLPLIVHATSLEAAKDALRAGARLLVHSVTDRRVDREFLDLALEAGAIYNPTLTVYEGYQDVRAGHFREGRYPLGCVDPSTLGRARRTGELRGPVDAEAVALAARETARQRTILEANLRLVHEAGVTVAMGTDAGNPLTLHGASVHRELEAMQEAGLSPADVVVAATRNGAVAMGWGDRIGTLEEGRFADVLVLDADPTEHVRAFRALSHVILGGRLHERSRLLPPDPG